MFCFFVQIIDILAKKGFLGFLGKLFKNKKFIQKSEKTFPRYMCLDGFGEFLVIVKKLFLTLVGKKSGQITLFWCFLTAFSTKKCDDLNRFLFCEIPFLKMYTFIYFTLFVFKLRQKEFSKKNG